MTAAETQALASVPHDRDAEMSVLGAMMLSDTACAEALTMLEPRMFYVPAHEQIFAAVAAVFAEVDGVPDAIAVHDWLQRRQAAGAVGGAAYLHSLVAATTTVRNLGYWARIVVDHYRARLAQAAYARGLQHLRAGVDVDTVLEATTADLGAALTGGQAARHVAAFGDVLDATLEEVAAADASPDGAVGVRSGLADLDATLGGMRAGQLIVVGGRPAMGKSLLLAQMTIAAAQAGHPSLYVSLEMSGTEIGKRALAAAARVPLDRLVKGGLSEADWARLAEAKDHLALLPLDLYCAGQVTVAQVRAEAHRLRLRYPTDKPALVSLDYLQLLHTPGAQESRQVEVSGNSRALKNLAADLRAVVVAASQLNRGPENRAVTLPRLADLRESGAVEQDSDVVILLHREDYYDPGSQRVGEVDLVVAKNRNGPTGKVACAFLPHHGRIADFGNL